MFFSGYVPSSGIAGSYTMEYYSVKRNEIGSAVETWMDLEMIILSGVSQTEKDKFHMISLICGI